MHPRFEPWLVSLVFALALFSSAVSSESAGAAAAAERSPFEGLFTRAACDGPAGPFSTEIISLADGTCRFVQIRGDDRSEILRTGARFTLGKWELVFVRAEFADHGRPYGGRQGGEGTKQKPQPARPDYAHGGTVADPRPLETPQD